MTSYRAAARLRRIQAASDAETASAPSQPATRIRYNEHMAESEKTPGALPPPWDRIFSLGTRLIVWGSIAALIYILRPFFLLLFLTFVFAYIQAHGVEGLAHRIRSRPVRVMLVFLVFLGTVTAIGIFLVPNVEEQVRSIAANYESWTSQADVAIKKWLARSTTYKLPADFKLQTAIAQFFGLFGGEQQGDLAVQHLIELMRNVATYLLGIGSAFFLSLLFSFLIVLDLPKLTRGVQGLAQTKVGWIYNEVADNVYSFCRVLGRAMEAQSVIALCNATLTALGLWLIGIGNGNLMFLATIVFLCSFVPVAGVFISSTPICIAALTEGGIPLMLGAIGMIIAAHLVEAYVLNPQIYGHHLRMNPVLTLIILVVCGKLFGPWGLILGIPVVNYVFAHAIRYKQPQKIDAPPTAHAESA